MSVDNELSSTWFCQEKFIHFASKLRINHSFEVASVPYMLEINLKYFSSCLMLHFVKTSLHFSFDKVELKENHLFLCWSFLVSIHQTQQAKKLFSLKIEDHFFLFVGMTTIEPSMIQNSWWVILRFFNFITIPVGRIAEIQASELLIFEKIQSNITTSFFIDNLADWLHKHFRL